MKIWSGLGTLSFGLPRITTTPPMKIWSALGTFEFEHLNLSEGVGVHVTYDWPMALQTIVTWGPLNRQMDRHDWKHYLPTSSLAGGNKQMLKWMVKLHICPPPTHTQFTVENQVKYQSFKVKLKLKLRLFVKICKLVSVHVFDVKLQWFSLQMKQNFTKFCEKKEM